MTAEPIAGDPSPARGPWHIVTGEYPPQPGGVSDYTEAVARGLARCRRRGACLVSRHRRAAGC